MTSENSSFGKGLFKALRFFWVVLILILAAVVLEKAGPVDAAKSNQIRKIAIDTEKTMESMRQDLSFLEDMLRNAQLESAVREYDRYIEQLSSRRGFSTYIFNADSLVLWSDNSIPVSGSYEENSFKEGLVFISNTWGICELASVGNYKLAGITHLQRQYPYENEFLSNDFLLGSRLNEKFRISADESQDALEVINSDGEVLFTMTLEDEDEYLSGRDVIVIVLYVFAVLAFLIFIQELFLFGYGQWRSNWWLVGLAADLILVRWLMVKFSIPDALYSTSFFMPFEGAFSFFNSKGDLIISGLFLFLFFFNFQRVFSLYPERVLERVDDGSRKTIDSFTIIGWIAILLAFFGLSSLFQSILVDRENLIEVYKVLSLNVGDLADLLFFVFVLAAFSLFTKAVIYQIVPQYSPGKLTVLLLVTLVLIVVFSRFFNFLPTIPELVLLILLITVFIISAYQGHARLNHSYSVIVVIIGSIFLIQLFFVTNRDKEYLLKRDLLESLANEHDIIAEMLLAGIDNEIINDKELSSLVLDLEIPESTIQSYLKSNYFGFYWNRYDFSANICDSSNSVTILPENREEPCLEFFNNPIKEVGNRIPGTSFFYLDNFDGRINYTGKYSFYDADSSYAIHLFLSLDSRLVPQELGYPDLLISGMKNRQDSIIQNYSYAKYQEGKLVSKTGDYVYSTDCTIYPEKIDSIVSFTEDNYDHLIYKLNLNPDQTIILSSPRFRFLDHLVSFSYVFVALYIIWLLTSSLYYIPLKRKMPKNGLKNKIEFVMVGVLLVSFILIGGGMTYYIVDQYDKTNRNTISEKTQSVLIELTHKLNEEQRLTPEWSSEGYPALGDLLIKFSYVFNSDINLFDPQGNILATSRPEIFDRQLVGRKMDPVAYHELSVHNQMEFVHFESIGNMEYWSAYVPFYNIYNDLVAYLNLPYFAKQSVLRQEVSTFIVAILNAYFLLIFLAVVLAVFLSNQVTKPLRLLQEKFTRMELGGVNQMVEYKRSDEIGSLVKSYNRMVDELERSAEKLAKSERETAWREMARQIAHEIKNPLTPMKLSVQHLRKAWDDKADDWGSYFERVSQTLIEQINSLSAIADEFAQFARMPQSRLKVVDVTKKITKSVALFELSEPGKIIINGDTDKKIPVYIDEEQLQQVFNNLLKNAFQSVPKSRQPKIVVGIHYQENDVLISFRDNGSGVDPEISEKLFQPNFTTKSSGMGLGLAISKSIIESAGGKIWYETGEKPGSIFYISLPLYHQ